MTPLKSSLLQFFVLFRLPFALACTWCSWASVGYGQFDDEPPEFLPGLIAEYSAGDQVARRIDQDVLFDWQHQSPDPRLGTELPFSAVWSGILQVKDNGQFRLSTFVGGKVVVLLDGEKVLAADTTQPQWVESEPLELQFGRYDLRIEFHRTAAPARLGLYWSGPGFQLEPVTPRYLAHRREDAPRDQFMEGYALSRGLRCAACHDYGDHTEPLAAPALTHLRDNLQPGWLLERLTTVGDRSRPGSSMPHFNLSSNDAADISAALFAASSDSPRVLQATEELAESQRANRKESEPPRTTPSAKEGELQFVSQGCLACHQSGALELSTDLEQQLFAGGDLSGIAAKRTSSFLLRWLADPAAINADHRMPHFELSPLVRHDLALYLSQQAAASADTSAEGYQHQPLKDKPPAISPSKDVDAPTDAASRPEQSIGDDEPPLGDSTRGQALIEQHRCGACHRLPETIGGGELKLIELTQSSDWDGGCLTIPAADQRVPGFQLDDRQRRALREYVTTTRHAAVRHAEGQRLLFENNCLACHSRDEREGLKQHFAEVAAKFPDVAPRLAALAPPSLTGIGDKLHDAALHTSIARKSPARRPWLDIQMPRFPLSDDDVDAVVEYLVAHDRIPEGGQQPVELPQDKASELAAARLVTAEGFGCQSCHQIGDSLPPQVALNAHGTDLTMLGDHIRQSWFDRWVRNPARIVPRMEMPAIQTAAKGVLNDSLDMQLAALWKTLNTPDFRPPRPNPVRVVRAHNLPEHPERAHLLTDVLETPRGNFLRPLVFGLPNRHNFLFDLETARLAAWWLGDVGHQHTRGKSWFWEPGAEILNEDNQFLQHIQLVDSAGNVWKPAPYKQFAVRFDRSRHVESGVQWQGAVHFMHGEQSRWLELKQTFFADTKGVSATSGCRSEVDGLQSGERIEVVTPGGQFKRAENVFQKGSDPLRTYLEAGQDGRSPKGQTPFETRTESRNSTPQWLVDISRGAMRVETEHKVAIAADTRLQLAPDANGSLAWTCYYHSNLPTDQFPVVEVKPLERSAVQLEVVPGYEAVQLPLPPREMPISFAWDEAGEAYFGSLTGRVLRLLDSNGDGMHDDYQVISDEIPTPYGLHAQSGAVDALAKYGLLRLTASRDGHPIRDAQMIADGWGYTADYHDWAVGLERDPMGNYYMALPCQQDDRSLEAAYLRGNAMKLVPDPNGAARPYRIEPIAAGLRFPMGIALSPSGELFTSDNQGNYNPFNELNHLREGKRYGFINKLENKNGFSPPFESPAINLPHPWTRSVNGICFLNTPSEMASDKPLFGPFEGHLLGCEMNGRFLVRMSLQRVGETYQGAAYLFSRPPTDDSPNFEGPIVCEVAPTGDVFIGNLLDSGWGGGQNTGSIVRLRPRDELPLGIAEIRATSTGFEIDLTQPADRELITQSRNYQIRSYQRISTPAYGGDDQDEREETIAQLSVTEDRRRITLRLTAPLRAGYVYEFNLSPLTAAKLPLFPSQAHYTLRTIPPSQLP